MSCLESAPYADSNLFFLTMMSEHHNGAIEMAEAEVGASQSAEAKNSLSKSRQSDCRNQSHGGVAGWLIRQVDPPDTGHVRVVRLRAGSDNKPAELKEK